MDESAPRVSIVVLNWNNSEDTIKCIESLMDITYSNFDVIIVDNNSSDNSASEIHNKITGKDNIELIENNENLGFGGGNNTGINHAIENGSKYVLLMNNDVLVSESFLEPLVRSAESAENTGIVIPKTLNYEGEEIQDAGRSFSPTKLRLENPHKGKNPSAIEGEFEVNSVCFSCVLLSCELYEDIGPLNDGELFFGGEDVDYCVRAKDSGWKIMCNAESTIKHRVSATGTRDTPFEIYHRARNQLYLGFQYFGMLGILGVGYKSIRHFFAIVYYLIMGGTDHAEFLFRAHFDYYTGNFENTYTEYLL